MYTESRIPRLRAALWVSTPDQPPFAEQMARSSHTSAEVAAEETPEPSLIVPDGCMDLIVLDSDADPAIVIAGADTTARIFSGPRTATVGLRFDPGVLPQLLATSASELADTVTPLEAVSAVATHGAVDGRDADAAPERLLRIAEILTSRADLDLRPLELARTLGARRDGRQPDIAEVAAGLAYSPRQLRRLSAEWFGYGPKHLAKILRWQAARSLIDSGRTRTAAAAATGYSDAAHLWRDERSLLGR